MKKSWIVSSALLSALCITLPAFAGSSGTSGAPSVTHAPRISNKAPTKTNGSSLGWSSLNWSGYAIIGSTYKDITGSWKIPSVSATKSASYSSTWIGIDGFNNSNLIQTGTESDYYSGSAHYYAWWEILPAAETRISMTVHPGDTMYAHIKNNGNGTWTITIQDQTTGQSFTTTQAYSGPADSAEWIQEAPTVGGRIATLAHFSETTIDPGTVNNGNPNLTAADGGYMVNRSGTAISTPSLPDSDKDGFNVSYGATAPAPPNS